jgi:hydroxymethylpyrimidine/phosphomethylpyrimidine kinase
MGVPQSGLEVCLHIKLLIYIYIQTLLIEITGRCGFASRFDPCHSPSRLPPSAGLRYSRPVSQPPVILSIAGYDPISGAGITADIKTSAAQNCYAITCITALTVQSTQGVFGVQPLDPKLVVRTLAALADDLVVAAVRVGMLGSGEIAAAIADFLAERRLPNVVLDPVLRSSSGSSLLDEGGQEVLVKRLLPLCDVITPNIDEAARLAGAEPVATGSPWDEVLPRLREMAGKLRELGSRAVVITGGHLPQANDYLLYGNDPGTEEVFSGAHLDSRSTHGTGCAFATALACQLAHGNTLPEAVRTAKEHVRKAIATAYPLGKGMGPINHGV